MKDFGDYDADGLITLAEVDTSGNSEFGTGDTCWGSSPSDACRVLDFDFDDDVDNDDKTVFDALVSATAYRQPGRTFSALGNTRLHQGLIYDAETGRYNDRHRQYASQTKRFMLRDPPIHGASSMLGAPAARTEFGKGCRWGGELAGRGATVLGDATAAIPATRIAYGR